MNAQKATGLGEPEPIGKKSLFQPPPKKQNVAKENPKRAGERTPRLRITTDLTKQALETIHALQHQHRLQTGKILPTWKIVSAALEKGSGSIVSDRHITLPLLVRTTTYFYATTLSQTLQTYVVIFCIMTLSYHHLLNNHYLFLQPTG